MLVDQPVEADGTDSGPTPTELFVGSLSWCVANGVAAEPLRARVRPRTAGRDLHHGDARAGQDRI